MIVTKDNFESEVLKSDIPVLLDFFANWCGPCKMLGPVLEQIAKENEGKLKVCKVDVDEDPELASEFGVTSIPSLFAMKGGQIIGSAVGSRPKAQILALFGE